MKIFLKCRKAIEKLKGAYRVYTSSKHLLVIVPPGIHVNRYGKTIGLQELAEILCEGSGHIPPRNFIADSRKHLRHEVASILKDHVSIVLSETNNPHELGSIRIDFDDERVATQVTALVKEWILEGSFYRARAPNSPKTIRNKGSDIPLVDTGQLVNSITAKIED